MGRILWESAWPETAEACSGSGPCKPRGGSEGVRPRRPVGGRWGARERGASCERSWAAEGEWAGRGANAARPPPAPRPSGGSLRSAYLTCRRRRHSHSRTARPPAPRRLSLHGAPRAATAPRPGTGPGPRRHASEPRQISLPAGAATQPPPGSAARVRGRPHGGRRDWASGPSERAGGAGDKARA